MAVDLVILVLVLGYGGFVLYRRHKKKKNGGGCCCGCSGCSNAYECGDTKKK